MATELVPHRCPKCNALVVDRRKAACTTCHAELPKEWIMTSEQVAKVVELDAHARAEHESAMKQLNDPYTQPGDAVQFPTSLFP